VPQARGRGVSDTVVGVLVMLVATSAMNVGAVLQKKAVDRLPPLDGQPLLASLKGVLGAPLWLVGWVLGTAAIVLNMVALGYADMSVVQPLNGFGLVVLALTSRAVLGERLTGATVTGMGAITAGLVILGLLASEGREWTSVAELHTRYAQPSGWGTLAALTAAVGLIWALAGRAPRWSGVALAFAAATSSVLGLTCAKGLFAGFRLEGVGESLSTWQAYALGIPLLGFSTLAIVLQQLSFQKGRAVVVTPVFGATSVALPLATGALVFGEAVGPGAVVAVGCVVVGVGILGSSGGPAQPECVD
jgi:drug/metabolite transporter (DMT)-like permease